MDFNNVLAEKREAARKSNLENLSHAYIMVEESEQRIQAWTDKKLAELAKLKENITELASQDNPDYEKVRELYNKAQDNPNRTRC